jgi:hypothetical protein
MLVMAFNDVEMERSFARRAATVNTSSDVLHLVGGPDD